MRFLTIFLSCAIAMFLAGCGESAVINNTPDEDQQPQEVLPDGIHVRPGIDWVLLTPEQQTEVVVDEATKQAILSNSAAAAAKELKAGDILIAPQFVYRVTGVSQGDTGEVIVGIDVLYLMDVIYGKFDVNYTADDLASGAAQLRKQPLASQRWQTRKQALGFSDCEVPDDFKEAVKKAFQSESLNVTVNELTMDFSASFGKGNTDNAFQFTGNLPLFDSEQDRARCEARYGNEYCVERFKAIANFEIEPAVTVNADFPFTNGVKIAPSVSICTINLPGVPLGSLPLMLVPRIAVNLGVGFHVNTGNSSDPESKIDLTQRTKFDVPVGFYYNRDGASGAAPAGFGDGEYQIKATPTTPDRNADESSPPSIKVEAFATAGLELTLQPSAPDSGFALVGPAMQMHLGGWGKYDPGASGTYEDEACFSAGVTIGPELIAQLVAEVDLTVWDLKKNLIDPVTVWDGKFDFIIWWDEEQEYCKRTLEGEVCEGEPWPCETGTICACANGTAPESECPNQKVCRRPLETEPTQVQLYISEENVEENGSNITPNGAEIASVWVKRGNEFIEPQNVRIDNSWDRDRAEILRSDHHDYFVCEEPLNDPGASNHSSEWQTHAITFDNTLIVEFGQRLLEGDEIKIAKPVSVDGACRGTGQDFLVGLVGEESGHVGSYTYRFSEHSGDKNAAESTVEIKNCEGAIETVDFETTCWPY